MKVQLPSRWIEHVDKNSSLHALAVEAISNRLAGVGLLLPLAAKDWRESIEHVHQLRIWSRRAAASLQLFRDLLPTEIFRQAWKRIRKIRRAAGVARDLDVMLGELQNSKLKKSQKKLLASLQRKRSRAQHSIRAVYTDFYRRGEWKRFCRSVLISLSDPVPQPLEREAASGRVLQIYSEEAAPQFPGLAESAGDWGKVRADQTIDLFFQSVPHADAVSSQLHQFRLVAKRTRYTLELLGHFYPEKFRNNVFQELSSIQDLLGDYNDRVNAVALIEKKKARQGGSAKNTWKRQLKRQRRELNQAREKISALLPQLLQQLRSEFYATQSSDDLSPTATQS